MTKKYRNALRKLIENQAKEKIVLKYNEGTEEELVVTVYPALPMTKRIKMVEEIVSFAFMGEGQSVEDYSPCSVAYAKKSTALEYFTDVNIPEKLDEAWLLLNYTTLFDDVYNIVGTQIDEIFNEADQCIKAKVKYLANKTDLNALIGNLSKKLENFGGEDFMKNFDIKSLEPMLAKLSGMSTDDIVDSILKLKSKEPEKEEKAE